MAAHRHHKFPFIGYEVWVKPDGTEVMVQVFGECTAADYCRLTKRSPKTEVRLEEGEKPVMTELARLQYLVGVRAS